MSCKFHRRNYIHQTKDVVMLLIGVTQHVVCKSGPWGDAWALKDDEVMTTCMQDWARHMGDFKEVLGDTLSLVKAKGGLGCPEKSLTLFDGIDNIILIA